MFHPIQVALDIQDRDMGKAITGEYLNHAEINLIEKPGKASEPNIYFLEDESTSGDVQDRIRALRRKFPQSLTFSSSPPIRPGAYHRGDEGRGKRVFP